jgi:hypothetical protein
MINGIIMSGKIRQLIDDLIEIRSQGNPSLASTTRTKLLLKGIDSTKYSSSSEDDAATIAKIKQIAQEMNISL